VWITTTEEIDPKFAVVEPSWEDARRRYYIEQGLELGAYIFDRLYRDLLTTGRQKAGSC
jgi:hypothetical protein